MSSNVRSWLLLAVIFILGIVTGWALTMGLSPHFQRPPGPHDLKKHWMAHLTHELNLTADEQAKIQPILTQAETRIQALHREEVGHGSQIIRAADDQIAAILTPEQKAELQKMESEREKMFSGHLRPWGAPHEGSQDLHPHDGPEGGLPPPPPPPPPVEMPTNPPVPNQ